MSDYAPHPGQSHKFETKCLTCGEIGMLNVSIITTSEHVAILDEERLTELYRVGDRAALARICDEVLDRSGALLGRIRERALRP